MTQLRERVTGRIVTLDPDMAKFYREEIAAGEIDPPDTRSTEPEWTVETHVLTNKVRKQSPTERALDTFIGASYELFVDGKRRATGIVTGINTRNPDLRSTRLEALQDRGRTGVAETAFPLDLVLSSGRGGMYMRMHLPGLDGVFAKGKLIEATRSQN